MKKHLITISSVFVTGIVCRGLLIKVIRKVLIDELDKMSKEPLTNKQFESPIFETRREADNILSDMMKIIEDYGVVTLLEVNDLLCISGCYTDKYYGWTDISGATLVAAKNGYTINLPMALLIKEDK